MNKYKVYTLVRKYNMKLSTKCANRYKY